MQSLFSKANELQLDTDQRVRAEQICAGINRFLVDEDIDPDTCASIGQFARSDHWGRYLMLNTEYPDQYPLFEIDANGFSVVDIDFIHAYCMDGNSLSSLINASDRDTVSADCILGQAFFYGLPSITTWFERHSPRIAQMKAFELVLANLMEADRNIRAQMNEEDAVESPFVTPRRSVIEFQMQGLYYGFYGKFRDKHEACFEAAELKVLFDPAEDSDSQAVAKAMGHVRKVMLNDGGACAESRQETAQNLLVSTLLNPGYFMMMSGEPVENILLSIKVKGEALARLVGEDPEVLVRRVQFLLLSIDPQMLKHSGLEGEPWFIPGDVGVEQLSGPLVGMSGHQSVPFSATYSFYRKHYGNDLGKAVAAMLESNHRHIEGALEQEQGYHALIDQMLQKGELSLTALRKLGVILCKVPSSIQRYGADGMVEAAVSLYALSVDRRMPIDRDLLPAIVRACEPARMAIINCLRSVPALSLSEFQRCGLVATDCPELTGKLRRSDVDRLFSEDLGL